jgi:hypothetical protein
LDAGPAFGAERRVELLAVPLGVPYDLARQPHGSGIYPLAKLFPIAVEDVVSPRFGVLEVQVIDERGEPLVDRAYELRVGHDTRVGVTDHRGMLAEPFLPEGIPILRFDGGHLVLFHDLYQPRVSLPPSDELDDFSHIADNLQENDDADDFSFDEELDEELDEDKDHVMD